MGVHIKKKHTFNSKLTPIPRQIWPRMFQRRKCEPVSHSAHEGQQISAARQLTATQLLSAVYCLKNKATF